MNKEQLIELIRKAKTISVCIADEGGEVIEGELDDFTYIQHTDHLELYHNPHNFEI